MGDLDYMGPKFFVWVNLFAWVEIFYNDKFCKLRTLFEVFATTAKQKRVLIMT